MPPDANRDPKHRRLSKNRPKKGLSIPRIKRNLVPMHQGSQSRFNLLAAESSAASHPVATLQNGTFLRKTRVGGCAAGLSGRPSGHRRRKPITAMASRACAYKTVLGRAKWLSRDPVEERGGLNLYATCGNNPLGEIDVLGRMGVIIFSEFDVPASQFPPGDGGDTIPKFSGWGQTKKCDTSKGELADYDLILSIKIQYKTGVNLTKKNSNGRTLIDHEGAHAQHWVDAGYALNSPYASFAGKCLCVPCYNALLVYAQAYKEYRFKYADYEDDTLDGQDWPGPKGAGYRAAANQDAGELPGLESKWKNALQKAKTACGNTLTLK